MKIQNFEPANGTIWHFRESKSLESSLAKSLSTLQTQFLTLFQDTEKTQ